jgi:RNA polymerase sigma-70 factor, ECF subfamily
VRETQTSSSATQSRPKVGSDTEFIRRAQQGDREAFERIYSLHGRRVHALCLRMVANSADADDLTQETFLQVFRKIGTFRGESAFSTWLHRLAFNVVLMRLRRRNFVETSLDEVLDPGEDGDRIPHDIGRPDLRLSGSVDRVNLERAMDRLPPGYRSIFVLHDVLGYEHNEIADIRGCSIGNSKSQLHKARLRLRLLLQTGRYEAGVGEVGAPEGRETKEQASRRAHAAQPALQVRAATA